MIRSSMLIILGCLSSAVNAQLPWEDQDIKRHWVKPAVISSSAEPFSLLIETWDDQVDSIVYYDSDIDNFYQGGMDVNRVVLLDNGLDGDDVAGDHVFTASSITIPESGALFSRPNARSLFLSDLIVYREGEAFPKGSDPWIILRRYAYNSLPTVNTISDQVQYTDRVFNYAKAGIADIADARRESIEIFYDHMRDDRHFILSGCTVTNVDTGGGAQYNGIKNKVTGIMDDNTSFDRSGEYGSDSVLEGNLVFKSGGESETGTFIHELYHRWGLALPTEWRMTVFGHWNNYISLNGDAFGGSGIKDIVDNLDGTYTIIRGDQAFGTYSAMDMYLAGYGSIDDIDWPIKILTDTEYLGNDSDNNRIVSSTTPLLLLDKATFLNRMGPRIPSYNEERHTHNLAMVVVSDQLLTPAELAFWHDYMKTLEGTDGEPSYYNQQTHGVANLATTITPLVQTSTQAIPTTEINLYPNPAVDYIDISSGNSIIKQVQILGINGTVYVSQGVNHSIGQIDIRHLNAGTYYVVLTLQNGHSATKEIVVIE